MRQDDDRDDEVPQAHRSPAEATLLSEVKKSLDLSDVVGYVEQMSSLESRDLWAELDRLDNRASSALAS